MKAAVLTVSDGVAAGTREDTSGDLLDELLRAESFEVVRRIVPDEREVIADAIAELTVEARLVLTTGGTGLAPRDVTPEATMGVVERAAPGIAEAIRAASIAKTPHALLSRGVAGVRGIDARGQPARFARRVPRRIRGSAAGDASRPRAPRRGARRRPSSVMSNL